MALSIFILPMLSFAQKVGTVADDFRYYDFKVGNEEPFVLYEGNVSFDACAFSEVASKMWVLDASSSRVRAYDLENARYKGVEEVSINLGFEPYMGTEGIVCSVDGKYFAVLERSSQSTLHVYNGTSGKELASLKLDKKFSVQGVARDCHMNFVSNTEVMVAGPKVLQVYNVKSGKLSKRSHRLVKVGSITRTGCLGGSIKKNKQLEASVFDFKKKSYTPGQVSECGNFVRVFDKKSYQRTYVRILTQKRSEFCTDLFGEFAISDNTIFPLTKGAPALIFPNYHILGWVNNDNLLIVSKESKSGFIVLNYSNIENEYEKQYIHASLNNFELDKVTSHLRNHPASIYRSYTLDGLVQMFFKDDSRFSYDVIRNTFRPYPEMKGKIEKLLAEKVATNSDALNFVDTYPATRYKRKVLGNAFKARVLDRADVQELRSNFPDDFFLTKFDAITKGSDDQRQNYLRSMYDYINPKNLDRMEDFYENYAWLKYAGKGSDVLSHVWKFLIDDQSLPGDYILYVIRNLPKDKMYASWGVSEHITDYFLDQRMAEEAGKVHILSSETICSSSDAWDSWLNSKYTAGIVSQSGGHRYVVYGVVRNDSRFSLPVKIKASANLMNKATAKGDGFFSSLIASLANSTAKEKQISRKTQDYYIPRVEPQTNTVYAIMLDFGDLKQYGLNIADKLKIYNEIYLSGLSVDVSVGKENVSQEVLTRQESWQQFARNGLPQVKLADFSRGGEEVNESVWRDRWIEREEQRRIAAERAARERVVREGIREGVRDYLEGR